MNTHAFIRTTLLSITLLAAAAVATGLPAPDAEPASIVAYLQEQLLDSMTTGGQTDWSQRFDQLEPVIENTHDTEFVARSILRKHWEELDEEQRRRFAETFRLLCIGTYADKFDSYTGEHFEQLSERELKRGSILVRTQLVRPDKEPTSLEYVLSRRSGRWRIVNIVADGVSDLALKRAEYGSVIEKEGFDGLLAKLEKKLADMSR